MVLYKNKQKRSRMKKVVVTGGVGFIGSYFAGELARLIANFMGRNNIEPIHSEPGPGDIRNSLADISKARAMNHNVAWKIG